MAGAAVTVAAWLATRPRVPWPRTEAPNVVVVVGCTVRRDQTTPYGGPDGTTPFLTSLAAGGARFEDALATSSWTREAVAGLLTGAPAASWGLPDPRYGEEVCAWIKLRDGQTATPDEIREFCKGQIAHYKIPRYVEFVPEFPMTITGKIQKFVMREATIARLGLNTQKTA